MKRHLLLSLVALLSALPCLAQVFYYTYEGQELKYTVLDEVAKTCEVSYFSKFEGDVIIPQTASDGTTDFTVTSIGESAFYYCYDLTSIEIPNSVTSIGDNAFTCCEMLTSVEIPNSVTSIGNYAFYICEGLTSVNIPNSVTSIGAYAFYRCESLTLIEIPNSVTIIGTTAFSNCRNLQEIKVDSDNAFYSSIDGVLFDKNQTTIIQYPIGTIETHYSIPNSVTSIDRYSFSNNSSLTSVEIPNSVTSISNWAFCGCSGLTSVEIPNSVTYIGDAAFYNCSSLTSVEISNSVISIGDGAFRYCHNLQEIKVDSDNAFYSSIDGVLFDKDQTTIIQYPIGTTDTHYSIPNSVTSIGDNAFCECRSLISVEIPNSVTSIGGDAFWSCSSLTTIISKAITPPCCKSSILSYYGYDDVILYVPEEAIDAYVNAPVWELFKNIRSISEYVGIEAVEVGGLSVEVDSGAVVVGGSENVRVYNMKGAQVYCGPAGRIELPAGVYIVATDSASKKVKI